MKLSKAVQLPVKLILPAFPCFVAAQQAHVIEEVHVTAVLRDRSANELAQSVSVVREQTLERISSASLGETLSGQLGVSSSYFSAGASRPIIRGLAGARVRIMEDGIDSMDASTLSVDHAVTIDPLVAEQIEIFRGPTTLLFGSGAVGGVVNTVTNRIPEYTPDDGFEGAVELRGDTAADARSGVIALDGGGENFAWHFDAVSRETDDYEIPGFADLGANEQGHDDHEAERGPDEDHDDDHEEGVPGLVENSDLSGEAFSLGGSWLRDNGFFGVSLSGFDTNYGIPGHHEHEDDQDEDHADEHDEDQEHAGEEEDVRVDMKQKRFDLKGGWVGLSGAIEAINLRFGANDYEHVELEGEEIGTRIENDAYEGRLEFMHAPWGAWDGAFGLQISDRDFSAIGAEAFVPPVGTSSYGAFIIEQRDVENWQISLGARLEFQEHNPSSDLPTVSDSATSFSLAGIRDLARGYSFAINAARAERLPVAEELYANGPHLATRTIEIGALDLGVETSRHLDIGIRKTEGELSWNVTAFVTDYDDFIFLEDTGIDDPDEALPIFNFRQRGAKLSGLEAEFFAPIIVREESELDWRIFADYVTGKLDNGEYLPRMPPLRYGSRIQYHDERFVAGFEVTRYADQDRIAGSEGPTRGYTMINADLNWSIATPGWIRVGTLCHRVQPRGRRRAQTHIVREGHRTAAGTQPVGRVSLALLRRVHHAKNTTRAALRGPTARRRRTARHARSDRRPADY